MVKIHGLVYILIGIFVAIASYLIDRNDLSVFLYVGMFFIAFGVAKIVIQFIMGQKEQQKPQAAQRANIHPQNFKKCQRCGNISRLTDRFCARCGNKLYVSMLF